MYADPLSVTIDGTAVSLPRVSTGGRASVYEDKSGTYTLNISHTNGKRQRSVIQLAISKTVPDSINPSINRPITGRVYMVTDTPIVGLSDAEVEGLMKALMTFVTVPANLSKFTGQES